MSCTTSWGRWYQTVADVNIEVDLEQVQEGSLDQAQEGSLDQVQEGSLDQVLEGSLDQVLELPGDKGARGASVLIL